jgi:hypothetical protein
LLVIVQRRAGFARFDFAHLFDLRAAKSFARTRGFPHAENPRSQFTPDHVESE